MQQKDDREKDKKHPIDMTTDEALDYLFVPEIAEKLRQEAGKNEPSEDCESED